MNSAENQGFWNHIFMDAYMWLRVNHYKIQWHDFLEYLCGKHFTIKLNIMLHKVDMYYYPLICLLLAPHPTSMQHIYLCMPRIVSLCIIQLCFKGLPFLAVFPKWSCHVQDFTVTYTWNECISICPLILQHLLCPKQVTFKQLGLVCSRTSLD